MSADAHQATETGLLTLEDENLPHAGTRAAARKIAMAMTAAAVVAWLVVLRRRRR